jgi:hypothetical protein
MLFCDAIRSTDASSQIVALRAVVLDEGICSSPPIPDLFFSAFELVIVPVSERLEVSPVPVRIAGVW